MVDSTERNNNLALAAGAKPGEEVTINGQKHTVSAAAANPAKPTKAKNTRVDPHPELGNQYLIKAITDAVGNYFAQSRDPAALATINAIVNKSGGYNVKMTDSQGGSHSGTEGPKKETVASSTSTCRANSDSSVEGGKSENTSEGENKQNGGAATCAVKGPDIKSTEASTQTFQQGGNSPIRSKGDQSISSEEGGIHCESKQDFTVNVSDGAITLTSPKAITLTVGKSKISITPTEILIYTGQVRVVGTKDVGSGKALIGGDVMAGIFGKETYMQAVGGKNHIDSDNGTVIEKAGIGGTGARSINTFV